DEELREPLLSTPLLLTDFAHVPSTGTKRRRRPVSSACATPLFIALILSRRATKAEMSASRSDNTPATARCSVTSGSGNSSALNRAFERLYRVAPCARA